MRWLHRQIRYTGIDLGQASIVPSPPAEVVQRGSGGWTDRATLLVARAVAQLKSSPNAMNTLAAVEAEAGELGRAIEDSWHAMALAGTSEPRAGDWYVMGRIYEQLALSDDAAAAYRRIPRDDDDPALSSYVLAQKRLAALPRPRSSPVPPPSARSR